MVKNTQPRNTKILQILAIKNFPILFLLLVGCKSPSDKIKDVILYNDSVGYWNYEWPRDRAEFYGFTFKFNKNGKLIKYSYSKLENERRIFNDPGIWQRLEWGVSNDSIFTLMNYNSQIKITKYNQDTIWLYDKKIKRKEMLIKVEGELNIVK